MAEFDDSHIRALGNQWIEAGRSLLDGLRTMHGGMQSMAAEWTGKAGRAAQVVWNGNGKHNIFEAIWEAGTAVEAIGNAILNYADELRKTVQEINRAHLIEGLVAIFGTVLGFLSFPVGGLLGRFAGFIGELTTSILSSISRVGAAAAALGRAATFAADVFVNGALQLVNDVISQVLAKAAAHAPVDVHLDNLESMSVLLAGWMGALFGFQKPVVSAGGEVPHVASPRASTVPSVEGSVPHLSPSPGHVEVPRPATPGSLPVGSFDSLLIRTSHAPRPGTSLSDSVIEVPRSAAGAEGIHTGSSTPRAVAPEDSGSIGTPSATRPGTPLPGGTGRDVPVPGTAGRGSLEYGTPSVPKDPVKGDATPGIPSAPGSAFLEPRPGTPSGGKTSPPPHDVVAASPRTPADGLVRDELPLAAATGIPAVSGVDRGVSAGGGAGGGRGTGAPAHGPEGLHERPADAGAAGGGNGLAAAAGHSGADAAAGTPVRSGGSDTAGAVRPSDMPQNSRGAAAGGVRSRAEEVPLSAPAAGGRAAPGDRRLEVAAGSGHVEQGGTGARLRTAAGEPELTGHASDSHVPPASASPAGRQHDIGSDTATSREGKVTVETGGSGQVHGGGVDDVSGHGPAVGKSGVVGYGPDGSTPRVLRPVASSDTLGGGGGWTPPKINYPDRGNETSAFLDAPSRGGTTGTGSGKPAVTLRNGGVREEVPSATPASYAGAGREIASPDSTAAHGRVVGEDAAPAKGPSNGAEVEAARVATDSGVDGVGGDRRLEVGSGDGHVTPGGTDVRPKTSGVAESADTGPAPDSLASPAAKHHDIGSDPVAPRGGEGSGGAQGPRQGGAAEHTVGHGAADGASATPGHDRVPDHKLVDADTLRQEWDAFKQGHDARTGAIVEAEARTDSTSLDAAWNLGRDKWAQYNKTEPLSEREIAGARLNWRHDISEAIQAEVDRSAYVSGEALDHILNHAGQNAYKHYIQVVELRQFATDLRNVVGEARGSLHGEDLPSLGDLAQPRVYDHELNMFVKDDAHLQAGGDKTGDRPDVFRNKEEDFNPIEQWAYTKMEQFEEAFASYRNSEDTGGALPRWVRDRLDGLLVGAGQDLERMAVREHDVRMAMEEHFAAIRSDNPEMVPRAVLDRVEWGLRSDLRALHEEVYPAGVNAASLARWRQETAQVFETVPGRIEREDYIFFRVKEEREYADSYLKNEDFVGDDGPQRVLGEYLDKVRKLADWHFTNRLDDARDLGGPAMQWTSVRDDLRSGLGQAADHEGNLQVKAVQLARDFHAILGHPEDLEAFSFHLADSTRIRAGDRYLTEGVKKYDELYAPWHDTERWLAFEKHHEDRFGTELGNLQAPRPEPASRPGDNHSGAGEGLSLPPSLEGRPEEPKSVIPAAATDHEAQLQAVVARGASDVRDLTVHMPRATAGTQTSGTSRVEVGVRDWLRQRGSAVSDEQISRVLGGFEGDRGFAGLPVDLRVDAVARQVVAEKALAGAVRRQAGLGNVEVAEVWRVHGELVRDLGAGFAKSSLQRRADEVAKWMLGERALGGAVGVLRGEAGGVDVSVRQVVDRVHGDLVRELGNAFGHMPVEARAQAVADRIGQERASFIEVNKSRGVKDFVGSDQVRWLYEDRRHDGGDADFGQLTTEDGQLSHQTSDTSPVEAGVRDWLRQRGSAVSDEQISRVLGGFEGDRGFAGLPVDLRVDAVARQVVAENALAGAVRRQAGLGNVEVAEVWRVHGELVRDLGAGFAKSSLQRRADEVAKWMLGERALGGAVGVLRGEAGGVDVSVRQVVDRVHGDLVRELGNAFGHMPVEARAQAVADRIGQERASFIEVNKSRGVKDFVGSDQVRWLYEDRAHAGQGTDFWQLTTEERTRVVAEQFPLTERDFAGKVSDRVRERTDFVFTEAEINDAHRQLAQERPQYAQLPEQVQVQLVADALARPVEDLERATNSVLFRQGKGSAQSAEVYRAWNALNEETPEAEFPQTRDEQARAVAVRVLEHRTRVPATPTRANDTRPLSPDHDTTQPDAGTPEHSHTETPGAVDVQRGTAVPEEAGTSGSQVEAGVRDWLRQRGSAVSDEQISRVLGGFEGDRGFAGLPVDLRVDAVARQVVAENALAGAVRRQAGLGNVEVAEVWRVHGELVRDLGAGFAKSSLQRRADEVAKWMLGERALGGAVGVLRGEAGGVDVSVRQVVDRVHGDLVRELGNAFGHMPVEARAQAVAERIGQERASFIEVNKSRGVKDFVGSDQVRWLYEDRAHAGQGTDFWQLTTEERTRVVAEQFPLTERDFAGKVSDRVRERTDFVFTEAEINDAHRQLAQERPQYAQLPEQVQVQLVADALARPVEDLERATNKALRGAGKNPVESAEVYRAWIALDREGEAVPLELRDEPAWVEQALDVARRVLEHRTRVPATPTRANDARPLSPDHDTTQPDAGIGADLGEHSEPPVRLMPESEVPQDLRLQAELPGEVNMHLVLQLDKEAVPAERVLEAYHDLRESREDFAQQARQSQVQAVARYIAGLDPAAEVLAGMVLRRLQERGAYAASDTEISDAQKELVKGQADFVRLPLHAQADAVVERVVEERSLVRAVRQGGLGDAEVAEVRAAYVELTRDLGAGFEEASLQRRADEVAKRMLEDRGLGRVVDMLRDEVHHEVREGEEAARRTVDEVHHALVREHGDAFLRIPLEARGQAVADRVAEDRALLRQVNELRGANAYVTGAQVRWVYEDLAPEDRAAFSRLPLEERARVVAEQVPLPERGFVDEVRERLRWRTEFVFSEDQIRRAHQHLVNEGAGNARLSEQEQARLVAEALARPVTELAAAVNTLLIRDEKEPAGSAELSAVHRDLEQETRGGYLELPVEIQALLVMVRLEETRERHSAVPEPTGDLSADGAQALGHPSAVNGDAAVATVPPAAQESPEFEASPGVIRPHYGELETSRNQTPESPISDSFVADVNKHLAGLEEPIASHGVIRDAYDALVALRGPGFHRQDPMARAQDVAWHIAGRKRPAVRGGASQPWETEGPSLRKTQRPVPTGAGEASGSGVPPVVRGTRDYVPIGRQLDQRRPPRLDPGMPPPPLPGNLRPVRFAEGWMPPYMSGRVADLLPELPPEVLRESISFGHSVRTLRGVDLALQHIADQLRQHPGTAPEALETPDGGDLLQKIGGALRGDPQVLFTDGVRFDYRTAEGEKRQLLLGLQVYGNWRKYRFGLGSLEKVDTMRQLASTSGRTVTNGTSSVIAPSLPLGLVGAAVMWHARISTMLKLGKRSGYDLQKRNEIEGQIGAADGELVQDDVGYKVTILDGLGRPVTLEGTPIVEEAARRQPTTFGFGIHHGLQVRLDRSLTAAESLGEDSAPATLSLQQWLPRMARTVGFGPMRHVQEWALAHAGGAQDSVAAAQIRGFFSTENFHRLSDLLNTGRVLTEALYGGRGGTEPAAMFSVRVESGTAVLVSVAKNANMSTSVHAKMPNGRTITRGFSVGLGVSAGPGFDGIGLGNGSVNVRGTLGFSGSGRLDQETDAGWEVSGSSKYRAATKDAATALYLVPKKVVVTTPPRRTPERPAPGLDASGRTVLLKNLPRIPATEEFWTWSLEQMTVLEARDRARSGAGVVPDPGGEVPLPPLYLTENAPPMLGMSRVEEITFPGGAFSREGADQHAVTVLDEFRGAVLRRAAETVPIALDHQLHPHHPRWTSTDEYMAALYNRQQVDDQLQYHSVMANLGTMATTGVEIALVGPGMFRRTAVYLRVRASLTRRRYEGSQSNQRNSYSTPVSTSVSGQQTAAISAQAGVEAALSLRDPAPGMGGGPLQAGTASAGVRLGVSAGVTNSHAIAAAIERKSTGSGVDLYRYDLALSAELGGYREIGHIFPFARLLVSEMPSTMLAGQSDSHSTPNPGTLGMGEVLLSVPVEHRPLETVVFTDNLPRVTAMSPQDARALALGRLQQQNRSAFSGYPYQTIAVTGAGELSSVLREVLREASGGFWRLTKDPAPELTSALRYFEAATLTGNFDETSAPSGFRTWMQVPATPLPSWNVKFALKTSVVGPPTVVTPAVNMEVSAAVGSYGMAAGRTNGTRSVFTGGQVTYSRSYTAVGPVGNHSLVASPFVLDVSQAKTVRREVYEEVNRVDNRPHLLLAAPLEYKLAVDATSIGRWAQEAPFVPRSLSGASAGRTMVVENGWWGQISEPEAYKSRVVANHFGDLPRYTREKWVPNPWAAESAGTSWPVNTLDTAEPLAEFERQLKRLGLSDEHQAQLRAFASDRMVLAMGKTAKATGVSIPARIGRWGSESLEMWVGDQKVRLRIQLLPAENTTEGADGTFDGLGHSVSLSTYREAKETIQETHSRSSGATIGLATSVAAATGSSIAGTAASSYSHSGTSVQSAVRTRTTGGVRVQVVVTTQAYGEYTTPYTLRLELEVAGGRSVSVQRPRRLTEHFPLSLMLPGDQPSQKDVLAPPPIPEFTGPRPAGHVLQALRDGTWHHVRFPGDDVPKPFVMPESGFVVRGILGFEDLEKANVLAMGIAYDTSLALPAHGPIDDALLARAKDTPLTRPGTGAAQSLKEATSSLALMGYLHKSLQPGGLETPQLSHRGLGGADGHLTLYSRPDFLGALLLGVADGVQFDASRQGVNANSSSYGRSGAADRTLDAGPAVTSAAGTIQLGGLPGVQVSDSVTANLARQDLTSVSVNPGKNKRAFFVAVPWQWLSSGQVYNHIKDNRPARWIRSVFGNVTRDPQIVETTTWVVGFVEEDLAREWGLITDVNFPAEVSEAWDAVGQADTAWTDADKAYMDLLRAAESANLHTELSRHEARVAEFAVAAQREAAAVDEARVDLRDAEPAHDGWEAEQRRRLEEAQARLAAVNARLTEASRERDAVQARLEEISGQLQDLKERAESLAAQLAEVRRGADRLTRWYQVRPTGVEKPGPVTFAAPEAPKAEAKTEAEASQSKGKQLASSAVWQPAGDAPVHPAYSTAPWQPRSAPESGEWVFDTATDHRILSATFPDGTRHVFDLRQPAVEGNGFYAAVWRAGGFQGDSGDLATQVARRSQLPNGLRIDPDAVFRAGDLEEEIPALFSADPELREQITRAGGRLPVALLARLADEPNLREAVLRLTLDRAHRWDDQTAEAAASLTARHLGKEHHRGLIVVQEDGSYQVFPQDESGPHPVIVYRQADAYLAAVPRHSDTAPYDPIASPAEAQRKAMIRKGKRPETESEAELYAAVAEAVHTQSSLRGLDPHDVIRALAIWQETTAPRIGTNAWAQALGDRQTSDLARITRAVLADGEAQARAEAARLASPHDFAAARVHDSSVWCRLEDFTPTSREGIWLFAVDEDGKITIGREQDTPAGTDADLDGLWHKMRQVDENATLEQLKASIDELGPATGAAEVRGAGTTAIRPARVRGELSYNHGAQQWELTDQPERYLGHTIRTSADPVQVRQWLSEAALRIGEQVGEPITPLLSAIEETPNTVSAVGTTRRDEEGGAPAVTPTRRRLGYRERLALATTVWPGSVDEGVENLQSRLLAAGTGARSLVMLPDKKMWALNSGDTIRWYEPTTLEQVQAPQAASGVVRSIDLDPQSRVINADPQLLAEAGADRFCGLTFGAPLGHVG
ncbi:hypothetical protein [Actinacidiphila glaucinigra]|uniref:hypothetical protein n=1 Tax=Actinacidiphila glaucinigra TaxID=235986 RepID=UPI003D8B82A5